MTLEHSEQKRRLVRGRGSYIADIHPAGALHAAFVRSYLPSGIIRSVDLDAALATPGVVAAYTTADLEPTVSPLRITGPGNRVHDWVPLAAERVRFVGEPIAVVVAGDPYTAEDAAEKVFADIDPLPHVVTVDAALAEDAPVINAEAGGNVLFEMSRSGGDPDGAFAHADVVIERTFEHGRQGALPLETRGVLAAVEAGTDQLIVWTSTQMPHVVRSALAEALGRAEATVRVITPDVGGGFGLKATVHPEEIVLAWLAQRLRQPVRWIEDRRENLVASIHAHEERTTCRLAADHTGRLLALDIDVVADVGAFASYPFSASLEPLTTTGFVLGGYDIPNLRWRARGVATNKCSTGPYRGVGIPPGVFAGERLLDLLAGEIGIDRAELRLRNLVPPEAMPHTTATGVRWDSGDYPGAFRKVLEEADYEGHMRRRARRGDGDPVLGVGVIFFNELSGPGSMAYRMRGVATVPGYDAARVVMSPNGDVQVYTSAADAGQDHEYALQRAVSRELGVPADTIRVTEGDTATCPPGSGTFASRFGSAQLSAAVTASRQVAERLREVAALLLDCAADEVVAEDGFFGCPGGERRYSLSEVAQAAYLRTGDFLPPPGFAPGLEAVTAFDLPSPTYPYGAHFAAVELDPDTFQVRLLRYVGVEDCGVVVNERAVHEQVVGAIAMGLGNALLEEHRYDEDGQIRTGSMLDYFVPLATDMATIELHHFETPTERTPLGSKGVGEAGTIGAVGAIGTAVADALAQLGGEMNQLPASPAHLFEALTKSNVDTLG